MSEDSRKPDDLLLHALAHRATEAEGPCPDASLLGAFLTRGLTPQERVAIEKHLAACTACLGIVADLTDDEAEVLDEPLGTPHAPPSRTRPGRAIGLAAAAVVLLGLGVAFWKSRAPAPDQPATIERVVADLRERDPRLFASFSMLSDAELAAPPDRSERGGVQVLLPMGTALSTRPGFRVNPVAGARAYEVRLFTDAGDPLRSFSSSVPDAAYPEGEAELARGQSYLVEVTVERLGRTVGRGAFQVASAEAHAHYLDALQVIEEHTPSEVRDIVTAHLAIRGGHWRAAWRHARRAVLRAPTSGAAKATLRYVRDAIGAEADQEAPR